MAALMPEISFEKYSRDDFLFVYENSTMIMDLYNSIERNPSKRTEITGEINKLRSSLLLHINKKFVDGELRDERDPERYKKITTYANSQNCFIDYNKYDNIILMSDIHADFISFFLTLLQNNIIKIEPEIIGLKERLINDIVLSESQNRSKLILDILINFNISFSKNNTLLTILGDIVDGRRNYGSFIKNVTNDYGINELLIHMFLYNMRIDALNMKSNVICIIGNHDMETIIKPTTAPNYDLFYNDYVDYKTHICLDKHYRRLILLPFYLFDSTLFNIIIRDGNIIGYLSHASFSSFISPKLDNVRILNDSGVNKIEVYDLLYKNIKKLILMSGIVDSQIDVYGDDAQLRRAKSDDMIRLMTEKLSGVHESEPKIKDEQYFMSYLTWSRYFPNSLQEDLKNKYNRDKNKNK